MSSKSYAICRLLGGPGLRLCITQAPARVAALLRPPPFPAGGSPVAIALAA